MIGEVESFPTFRYRIISTLSRGLNTPPICFSEEEFFDYRYLKYHIEPKQINKPDTSKCLANTFFTVTLC
jgi:hypothetical protein